MRKLLILIILLIIILSANSQNLSSLVVVIDPGHGGKDAGCVVKNSQFIENAYCYDVSLRLERILKDSGIIVFKTTKDSKRRINNTILGNIPALSHAVFSIDGKRVRNGKGLYKRTDFCNLKFKKYHDHKIVFISIHFDVTSSNFLGARIIKEEGSYKSNTFSDYLEEELRKKNLLSNSFVPVFENGDPINYKKHLHVLSNNKNKISPKVLIELGNTQNKEDLLRIKNPNIREEYARVIFNALKKYIQKTD